MLVICKDNNILVYTPEVPKMNGWFTKHQNVATSTRRFVQSGFLK